MNRFLFILGGLGLVCCLNACKNAGDGAVVPEWAGVYTGVLPCADCPGIQTTIELLADSTYLMQTLYLDRSDELFTKSGNLIWDTRNNTVELENDFVKTLLVEDHTLTVLFEGEKETGILAPYYILKKTDKNLTGIHWKLVELNGTPVNDGQSPREPHIVLATHTHRFNGSTGCNTIMGSYQIKAWGKIAFSQAATTQMMCLDMDVENRFLKIFSLIDGYVVDGNKLTFTDASNTPLARFIAM